MTRPTSPLPIQFDPVRLESEKLVKVMLHLLVKEPDCPRNIGRDCNLSDSEVSQVLETLYLANLALCLSDGRFPRWQLSHQGKKLLASLYVQQCERGIHV